MGWSRIFSACWSSFGPVEEPLSAIFGDWEAARVDMVGDVVWVFWDRVCLQAGDFA